MATTTLALAPFSHELNTSGNDCSEDCPACRWVDLRNHQSQLMEFLLRRVHTRQLEANYSR